MAVCPLRLLRGIVERGLSPAGTLRRGEDRCRTPSGPQLLVSSLCFMNLYLKF